MRSSTSPDGVSVESAPDDNDGCASPVWSCIIQTDYTEWLEWRSNNRLSGAILESGLSNSVKCLLGTGCMCGLGSLWKI